MGIQHDNLCKKLTQSKLVEVLTPLLMNESIQNIEGPYFEFPLGRGEGKYYQIVGYIDCVIKIQTDSRHLTERHFLIECKTREEFEYDIGAVIRQIKGYGEYYTRQNQTHPVLLIATPELSIEDLELILSQGIGVIEISEKGNLELSIQQKHIHNIMRNEDFSGARRKIIDWCIANHVLVNKDFVEKIQDNLITRLVYDFLFSKPDTTVEEFNKYILNFKISEERVDVK